MIRSLLMLTWLQTKQLARTSFFLQTTIAAPVAFLLLRVAGAAGSTSLSPHLWYDASVAGLWAATTTATGMVGYQRFLGTFEQLASSVLPPSVVFGSMLSASALLGLIGVPSVSIVSAAVGAPISITFARSLGLVLSVLACLASALVLAAIFATTRKATAYEPILLVPVWLLIGVVIPLTNLPEPLRIVALLHPVTSAVAVGHASSRDEVLSLTAVSLVCTLIWSIIGSKSLTRALSRAAVTGSIGRA